MSNFALVFRISYQWPDLSIPFQASLLQEMLCPTGKKEISFILLGFILWIGL